MTADSKNRFYCHIKLGITCLHCATLSSDQSPSGGQSMQHQPSNTDEGCFPFYCLLLIYWLQMQTLKIFAYNKSSDILVRLYLHLPYIWPAGHMQASLKRELVVEYTVECVWV